MLGNSKQKLFSLFVLMTGMLFLVGGISYAALSYQGVGKKEVSIFTNGITFKYVEGQQKINIDGAMPMTDSQGKVQNDYFEFDILGFTDSENEIPFNVTVRKDNNSSDIDDAIKLYLTKVDNNGNEEEVKLTNFDNIEQYVNKDIDLSNHVEKKLYTGKVPSSTNYSQKYRLRVWISYDADYTNAKYNNAQFNLSVNVYSSGKIKAQLAPGLYDENDNLIESYDSLVSKYGFDPSLANNYKYYSAGNEMNLAEGWYLNDSVSQTPVIFDDIPNSLPVKVLAMPEYSNVRKIIFPDTLTSIGDNAFSNGYVKNIAEVVIPASVTNIGKSAFVGNQLLDSVVFENPTGWYYTDGEVTYSFNNDELSNPIIAASYLKSQTYSNYILKIK